MQGPSGARLFARGFALFGGGFGGAVLVLALLNALAAVVAAVAVTALSEAAWAQHAFVFADGELTDRGILLLVLQVGVPAGVVLALPSAVAFTALAAVFGTRYLRAEGRAGALGTGATVRRAFARALPLAGAVAIAAVEVVLAFVLAPAISLAGIVLLAVAGVRTLLRRRRGEAAATDYWLTWSLLIAYAIPFGLAAVILTHSLLILPVAAHEQQGVRGILRRSSELARGRAVRVALCGIGGFVVYGLMAAGLSLLGQAGVPQPVVAVAMILAQVTVAAIPIAILVAVYFGMTGGRVPPEHALAARSISRRSMRATTATAAAAVLVLGFLVPVSAPQRAWAGEVPVAAPELVDGSDQVPEPLAGPVPVEGQTPVEGSVPAEAPEGIAPLSSEGEGEGEGASGGEGEEAASPGDGAPAAPAWWSQGRPDGPDGARKFGSAACSDSFGDYEDAWGNPLNKPTLGLCIDALGDASDAVPGDGWCETAEGACTLRAAVEELSAWRAGHGGIYPASTAIASGTISLTAPLVPTVRFTLDGAERPAAIPGDPWVGLGDSLTIDGHGSVQLFRISTGSGGGAELINLTLKNGYAPAGAQGGAVQVVQGDVMLRNVILDGNYASGPGAANAVYGSGADNPGQVRVDASAFVNNGVPACHAPGFSADTWQGPTTIDVDDPSCPGTVSTATSLGTSVDVYANPMSPKKGGAVTYHATVTRTQIGAAELAGTVTFHVAGREPLTVDVPADGRVSVATAAAGTGQYTVRAVFSGSEGYRGSQGEATVTTDGTVSAVTLDMQSDSAQWHRGHPLTLTATVVSGADGGVPTGGVEFFGGGDSLGTAPIGADGRAVLETTITPWDGESFSGTQYRWWVEARYAGDTVHDGSSAGEHLYLAADSTSLAVTPSRSSASPGEAVTFTATVMTEGPVPVPVTRGTVTFSGPGGFRQDATLNAQGEATVTLSNMPYGTHAVSASFSGDRWRYADSNSSIAFPVTGKSPVAFSIAPPPSPSYAGASPRWSVWVQRDTGVPADGMPSPTGALRLMLGDQLVAEASPGSPDLIVTGLPVGTHTLRIEYDGDAVYLPHAQTVTHTVQQVPTRVLMTRSTTASVIGQPVDFSVSVNTSAVGQLSQPVTEGLVHLTFRGSRFATIDLAAGTGVTAALPEILGTEPILAVYEGTERYAASQSYAGVTHTHRKATAEVVLDLDGTTLPLFGTVEARVTVAGAAPTTLSPEFGRVQLYRNGTAVPGIAADLRSDGTATLLFDATVLGAGIHSLQARFSGNPWFDDRSSASRSVMVEKHVPTVTVRASEQSVWGQEVRLEADVAIPWPSLPVGADALGTVTFVRTTGGLETTLGTVEVTEQQRRATLVPTADQLPLGAHEIDARFTPSARTSDRLTFGYSAAVPHDVTAVPVLIRIDGLNGVLPGEATVRSVMVSEHPDLAVGTRPEGTVTVLLDGAPHATLTLAAVEPTGPAALLAFANIELPALAAGDHEISVRYTPAAGSVHAPESAAFAFTAGRISPAITIDAATRTVAWDQLLWVQASATKPFPWLPDPRGTLRITDGAGASCEFRVIPGLSNQPTECPVFFTEAGIHTLHAVFLPDAAEPTYAETTSSQFLVISVPHGEPGLTFTAGTSTEWGGAPRPTAGESITLRWNLYGATRTPAGGVALAVEPANAVPAGALDACDTTQRQGSCVVPLTVAGSARPVTFTAAYAGDVRFAAASRTAAVTPRPCVTLDLQIEPAGAGTLTPQQAPNCGDPGQPKTGYSDGTVVTFDIAPLPSGDPGFDWVPRELGGVLETAQGRSIGMRVGPDNDWARVGFIESYQCVQVIVDHTNVPGTTSAIRLPGLNGAPGTAPNCVYDGMQRSDLRYQAAPAQWSVGARLSNTQHYRAWYLRGTELSGIELRPGQVDTKLYAFDGMGFERQGEREIAPRTLMSNTQLRVTFGPSCYAATAEATGPGTLTVQNPVNCEEPLTAVPFASATPRDTPPVISAPGTSGWYAGTVLRYEAAPDRNRGDSLDYVKTWAGTDIHPETAPADYGVLSFWDENAGTLVDRATVHAHERAPQVEAAFGTCHRVVLERGLLSNNVSAITLPAFGAGGDCPHPLAGELLWRSQPSQQNLADGSRGAGYLHDYFAEGTEIAFETEPHQWTQMILGEVVYPSEARFRVWERSRGEKSWPGGMARASERAQRYTVTEPASFIPRYARPDACNAYTYVHSGDPSRVRVSSTIDGLIEERCDTLDFDGAVGDALSGYLPGKGSQYATLEDIERAQRGSITFTAHVDEALNPIVGWDMRATTADPRVPPRSTPGGLPLPLYGSVTVTQAAVGRQITMPLGYHSLTAKAVLCQVLDYSVNMTREDGVVIPTFDNGDDLLLAYPAPNCPYLPNAWTVGTQVELWAFGDPTGYRFTGWDGEVSGSGGADTASTGLAALLGDDLDDLLGTGFPADGVTVVTMDGRTPTKRVDANYRVQCYDVSFTSKKVESSTDVTPSNCPGFEGEPTLISNVTGKPYRVADVKNAAWMSEGYAVYRAGASEMIGRYIGGTEVIGIADTDWSDQVWLGWRGDVEDYRDSGRFNPATIVVDGDKDVINRYRDRSTGEELEKLGNDIAIGMKKAVGFASIVVTDYMINYPPIGTVFMVTEGMAMVGSLLEMAGVDKDAIAWMSYPQQLTDMIKAPLACIGTWALGSSGVDKAREVMSSASEAVKKGAENAEAVAEAAAKLAAHRGAMDVGNAAGRMATAKLKFYQAKLGLAKVKQLTGPLTSAVSVGTSIYGAIDDGLAWDKSAADAWTDFDAYTDCVKNSVPGFLKDAMSPEQEKAIEDYAAAMKEELLMQQKLSFESLTGFSATGLPAADAPVAPGDRSATVPEIPPSVCAQNGMPEEMCQRWGG